MLHSIGTKRGRAAGDLADMLLECHVRIRSFAAMAVSVAERSDTPSIEVSSACIRVERYFSEALPLHVRDEEESIAPRLRGRSSAVDAALDSMHEQHELHVDLLARVLAASAVLRSSPRDPRARAALLLVARPLRAVLEPHLLAEEEIVFPAVRALLSTADQAAILGELRARRGAG